MRIEKDEREGGIRIKGRKEIAIESRLVIQVISPGRSFGFLPELLY